MTNNNIIMMGMPGSGKSTVGWALAKLMGFGFMDLDRWIESFEKATISSIIERKGEQHFRELEKQYLNKLSSIYSHVISIGGGAAQREANWHLFKQIGVTIWLNPPVTELVRRLKKEPGAIDSRPLLASSNDGNNHDENGELTARLQQLFDERKASFAQADLAYADAYASVDFAAIRLKGMVREFWAAHPVSIRQQNRQAPLKNNEGSHEQFSDGDSFGDDHMTKEESQEDRSAKEPENTVGGNSEE